MAAALKQQLAADVVGYAEKYGRKPNLVVILVGGIWGVWGILVGLTFLIFNLCHSGRKYIQVNIITKNSFRQPGCRTANKLCKCFFVYTHKKTAQFFETMLFLICYMITQWN